MVSKEIEKGKNDEIVYPCLMQVSDGKSDSNTGAGSVYLFLEEGFGVCILGIGGDEIGESSNCFNMEYFHLYTGTVQLSNN